MSEFIIFLKYLISPSGFLKDFFSSITLKEISILFILFSFASLLILPYNKKIIAGGFLFLAILIQLRLIAKKGDHNKWKKEKLLKTYQVEAEKEVNEDVRN